MIRKLVLVRHGDAEFYGPEGTDESRRLTTRGLEALKSAYPRIFAALRDEPDVSLWVSPAVRAMQTAEVVGEALGIDPDEFALHDSLYEQDDDEFLAELSAEGEGIVVAVGHIPFMQEMLYQLTGEDLPFKKGAVACIAITDNDRFHGTLEWFETAPKR